MTISWVAIGGDSGTSGAGSGSFSPTMPSGVVDGDLLCVAVNSKPYDTTHSISSPSGFTEQATVTNGTTAQGVDTGSVRETVFTKTRTSSDTAVTVAYSAIYQGSQPLVFALAKTSGNAWNISATTGSDATSGSVDVSGATNLNWATGDWIVVTIACPTDVVHTSPSLSLPGCTLGTLTQRVADPNTTSGNDGSHFVYTAEITAGSSSGVPNFTASGSTNTGTVSAVFLRVSEAASGPITVNLGLVTEASTSQAVGRRKNLAVGQTTEADTAQAVGRSKRKATALATETGTAQPVTKVDPILRAIGQTTEASTAQAVARRKAVGVALASEANTAQPVTVDAPIIVAIGLAW